MRDQISKNRLCLSNLWLENDKVANDPLQLTDYCNVSSTERKCQVLLSLLDCTAQNNEDLSP